MKRTNTWADAMETGMVNLDFGDGLETELPLGGVASEAYADAAKMDRGSLAQGADANTLDLPGIYNIPNSTIAETVLNFGEKFPSVILNITGTSVVRAQVQFVYGARKAVLWRTMDSVDEWGDWENLSDQGASRGLLTASATTQNLDGLWAEEYTGTWSIQNITEAAKVTTLAVNLPGNVWISSTPNGVATQIQMAYGASGGLFERRTLSVTAHTWTPWAPLGGGGSSSSLTNVGLANSLLLDEFTGEMGGVHYTGGVGAAAVRIDHGLNNFNLLVRPLLEARGIPYCIALSSRRWDQEENNQVTPAMVDSWVAGGLCEIWNHGALAHNNATGLSAITDYWVAGKAELEAQLPSAKIYGAILPGTGTSNAFDGLGGASMPKMVSDSTGGQVILGSHAVISGAFSGTDLRVLDGNVRQGQLHYTIDARTPTAIISKISEAKSTKKGLQLMLHPSLVNTSGFITQAQLTEVLDHIVAERDANRLRVFSPYKMMLADSSR